MKLHRNSLLLLAATTLAGFVFTTDATLAADLTWDTATGDGPAITAGTGAWNTTAGNLVWNDGTTPNVIWSQTGTTAPLNSATFAGADGAVDGYVVTLAAQMAAQSLAFNSGGYKITGSTVSLQTSATTNGSITVAADKTATINSVLGYVHNQVATIGVGSGGVLNLGGGTQGSARPQWNFSGAGTINFTGGTSQNTVGSLNTASINLKGGTHTMTDTSAVCLIGNGAGQDVNYTVSGGTLSVLGFNSTAVGYSVAVGSTNGSFTSTLTLKTGGTVNIGSSTRCGQLNIGSNNGDVKALVEVQGGTLTVAGSATGVAAPNRIIFFAAGANAGTTATMTQSGGTVTAHGIQFGCTTGGNKVDGGGSNGGNPYDATSLATLRLSGGNLYIGPLGITRGSAAATLPVTIQLLGGTVGATTATWPSALDMKLGTSGGGVTFLAADSGGTARNITLSGMLSDDGAVNGSLTKTGLGTLTVSGANSYSGGTTVNAGTLLWSGANNLPATGTLQVNAGSNFSLADGTARPTSAAALGLAAGAFLSFDWNADSVDTLTSTAAATTAGTVGIIINNNSPTGSGGTLISSASGGLSGTQYFLVNNTNFAATLTVTDTTVSIGTPSSPAALTDAYWLGGQVTGALGAMALSNGTSNWASDAAGALAGGVVPSGSAVNVIFGANGATEQANISTGANMNLGSISFNDSAAVNIGGGYAITLNNTSATAAISSGSGTTVTPGSAISVTSSANPVNTVNANLILGANQTWNIASDQILTVGGAVSGTSTLTKADAGTLVLAGANTYTGTTTVSGGTLTLAPGGTLGYRGTIDTSRYAGAISIANGAVLSYANNNPITSATQVLAGVISGGGTLSQNGGSDLILSSGTANTFGVLSISGAGGGATSRVHINNATAHSAAATITIGNAGILVFQGYNTSATGAITVQDGGGIASRMATGTNVTCPVTLPGAGTVSFNNDDAPTGTLTIASAQTLTGNLTVQIGGNRTDLSSVKGVTLSGKLTGTGTLTVASSGKTTSAYFGTGVLTLTGPNDYSGGTILSQGTLTIGTGGTLGETTGALVVGNDNTTAAGTHAILNLATAADSTVGSLSGTIATPTSGTNTATINTRTGRTFTVNQTADGSYAGVIAGGGNFALGSLSTHTLILTGANTYSGDTTVNAGKLTLGNANPANDASTVTIATGAILDLTYTGTDKVSRLFIGTTPMASGVYGKANSASPIIGIAQITGDGTLTVAPVFSVWIAGTFANGQVPLDQRGPNDDPDNDGIRNLVEYAIAGEDPTVGNPTIGTFTANTLSFTKREGTSGLTYAIQDSTDLGLTDAWAEVSGGSYVNNPTTISFTLTPGTPLRNFIRLQVLSN